MRIKKYNIAYMVFDPVFESYDYIYKFQHRGYVTAERNNESFYQLHKNTDLLTDIFFI